MLRPSALLATIILVLLAGACGGPSAISPIPNSPTPGAGVDLTAASSTTPLLPAIRSALLSELRNTVEARKAEADDWKTAAEGDQIITGGGAKTGPEAQARLDITDGTILRLAASTEFVLRELSPEATDPITRFHLGAGKVWIILTRSLGGGRFEIEAPSGRAAVRGSMMSAEFFIANGQFIISCLEGSCRLTGQSGAFTDLVGGQQAGIPSYGQNPSPPKPIDTAQLSGWAINVPEAQHIVATITPGPPPTDTPTPRPTDTPTPTPGGTGQTACDHPYFPLRPGATWTYSTTDGTMVWTVTSVTGDTDTATASMTADISTTEGNVQVTYNWQCDATGIISYEFGTLNLPQFGQVASYELVSHSGTFLPPADLLVPGYAWSNEYQIAMQMAEQVGGISVSATSTTSERYIVAGISPVTFGDQTFDGLQIERSGGLDIQVLITGFDTPPTHFDNSGTMILARGVGPVQLDANSQLTAYSIP